MQRLWSGEELGEHWTLRACRAAGERGATEILQRGTRCASHQKRASKVESILDVRVSPAARHRAFRLVDALLKAVEGRGYQVSARGVTIEGQLVPIGVTEKDDRALHVPTAAERAEKRFRSRPLGSRAWTRIQGAARQARRHRVGQADRA
jgi:hypothetical protein